MDTEMIRAIASYLKINLERKWSFFSYKLKNIIRKGNTQNGQVYSQKMISPLLFLDMHISAMLSGKQFGRIYQVSKMVMTFDIIIPLLSSVLQK